jgi:hypothetical protein
MADERAGLRRSRSGLRPSPPSPLPAAHPDPGRGGQGDAQLSPIHLRISSRHRGLTEPWRPEAVRAGGEAPRNPTLPYSARAGRTPPSRCSICSIQCSGEKEARLTAGRRHLRTRRCPRRHDLPAPIGNHPTLIENLPAFAENRQARTDNLPVLAADLRALVDPVGGSPKRIDGRRELSAAPGRV